MNGTFRYHVRLDDPLKSAIAQHLAARTDDDRLQIRKQSRELIAQDDLLCQFSNDQHRGELIFNPDAKYPVQIQLGTPEMDIRCSQPLWPVRLQDHKQRVACITGVVFIALHPSEPYLKPGRYRIHENGPYAHVCWENASGGRYKVSLECMLTDRVDDLQAVARDNAMSRIWQLVHHLMTGKAPRLVSDDLAHLDPTP